VAPAGHHRTLAAPFGESAEDIGGQTQAAGLLWRVARRIGMGATNWVWPENKDGTVFRRPADGGVTAVHRAPRTHAWPAHAVAASSRGGGRQTGHRLIARDDGRRTSWAIRRGRTPTQIGAIPIWVPDGDLSWERLVTAPGSPSRAWRATSARRRIASLMQRLRVGRRPQPGP